MSREHRSNYRFPLPAGQDEAVLCAGRTTLCARLLNASASGFLLECPKVDAVAGDVLLLTTFAGRCEVRVAFAETTEDHTRLGVQRLRDLEEPLPLTTSIPWHSLLPLGGSSAGGAGSLVIAVATLTLIVAASLFVTQNWFRTTQSQRPAGLRSPAWFSRQLADADRRTREALREISESLWHDAPAQQADVQPDSATASADRISVNLTAEPKKNHQTSNSQ